jgi:hypothetical protein
MTAYTLTQAAAVVGRNRSTILRAVKAGRLSAARDEASGEWRIEPAELQRLYTVAPASGVDQGAALSRNSDATVDAELRARLADKDDQITDLRRRLDLATEQLGEALQQVRLLTDMRQAPARRWWRWGRD